MSLKVGNTGISLASALSAGSRSSSSAPPRPGGSSQSLSNVAYANRLESYLDSYGKGHPDRSSSIPRELQQRHESNFTQLGSADFKARTAYGLYSTALDFEARARFVSGVSYAADFQQRLDQLGAFDPGAPSLGTTVQRAPASRPATDAEAVPEVKPISVEA